MVKLKQISFPITKEDKQISSKKSYLIKYNRQWHAGKFIEEWYGWFFIGVYPAGCQTSYSSWQEIHEIIE